MKNLHTVTSELDHIVSATIYAEQTLCDHIDRAAHISGAYQEPETQEAIAGLKDAIQSLMTAAIIVVTKEGKLSDVIYREQIAAISDAIADLWEFSSGAAETVEV